MPIYDRRKLGKNKSVGNRKRFLKRYKEYIKEKLDEKTDEYTIKDVAKPKQITIKRDSLNEPKFNLDPKSGNQTKTLTGNRTYAKGDTIRKPSANGGKGRAGRGDDEEEDFTFTLTKEEFVDLFFEDMELPNFIKKSLVGSDKYIRKKAIARRIATRATYKEGKKPPFLDEFDLRYDYYTKRPIPIRKAVMFCVLDSSASMGQEEKDIAKKFFMLLYLFLEKSYEAIDIRFIRHTTTAMEVDEKQFFYSRLCGGTQVSPALHLIDTIIKKDYDPTVYNIYVAQASDGDNFTVDNGDLLEAIEHVVLPQVQYFAYIEIKCQDPEYLAYRAEWSAETVYDLYRPVSERNHKLNCRIVNGPEDVYPALKDLFKKGA